MYFFIICCLEYCFIFGNGDGIGLILVLDFGGVGVNYGKVVIIKELMGFLVNEYFSKFWIGC